MNKIKIFGLWILTIFFALSALVYFPSFSSLFAFILVCIVIPIPKWQNVLVKLIRGKLKVAIAIVLALLTIFTAPTSNIETTPDPTNTITTLPTTETTTNPTSVATTEMTTEPIIESTNEPITEPTTTATVPAHTHKYTAATCTSPKTCSCGATEGEATGHSWKAATCKAPKTCKTCGATTGDVADHSWKAATCKAPKTCKTCGATSGSVGTHQYSSGKCKTCGKADPNSSSAKPSTSTSNGDPDNDDTNGKTVYKTPTGKRYHIDPNCGGKNSTKTTLAKAKEAGLTPCKTCVK